jgi:hypothetical protein
VVRRRIRSRTGAPASKAAGPHGVPAGIGARRQLLTAVGHALAANAVACDPLARPRTTLTRAALGDLLGYEPSPGTRIRTFGAHRATRALHKARRGAAAVAPPAASAAQVARVAFVPGDRTRGRSLVVVRAEQGTAPEVRVVVPR